MSQTLLCLGERLRREDRVNEEHEHMPSQLTELIRLGVVSLTLTGCVMARGTEEPLHTYLLNPAQEVEDSPSSHHTHKAQAILLVSPPHAEPGFDTTRMVYLTRPYEVSYYAANQWAETPARMIRTLLLESLEKSGLWRVVAPIPGSVHGDYRLDTEALVLQQEFSHKPSQVRLGFRLQLVALHDQVVLGARRFEIVENAPSDDAYGGVVAANRAVRTLLDQVTEWMSSCMSNGASGRC